MIDPKALFPIVQKLLPQEPPQAIMAGILQFAKAHPNFNNQQALQALVMAMKQMSSQPQQLPPPSQPFGQRLLSQIPTGAK